jgi:hypothetical protein
VEQRVSFQVEDSKAWQCGATRNWQRAIDDGRTQAVALYGFVVASRTGLSKSMR